MFTLSGARQSLGVRVWCARNIWKVACYSIYSSWYLTLFQMVLEKLLLGLWLFVSGTNLVHDLLTSTCIAKHLFISVFHCRTTRLKSTSEWWSNGKMPRKSVPRQLSFRKRRLQLLRTPWAGELNIGALFNHWCCWTNAILFLWSGFVFVI